MPGKGVTDAFGGPNLTAVGDGATSTPDAAAGPVRDRRGRYVASVSDAAAAVEKAAAESTAPASAETDGEEDPEDVDDGNYGLPVGDGAEGTDGEQEPEGKPADEKPSDEPKSDYAKELADLKAAHAKLTGEMEWAKPIIDGLVADPQKALRELAEAFGVEIGSPQAQGQVPAEVLSLMKANPENAEAILEMFQDLSKWQPDSPFEAMVGRQGIEALRRLPAERKEYEDAFRMHSQALDRTAEQLFVVREMNEALLEYLGVEGVPVDIDAIRAAVKSGKKLPDAVKTTYGASIRKALAAKKQEATARPQTLSGGSGVAGKPERIKTRSISEAARAISSGR